MARKRRSSGYNGERFTKPIIKWHLLTWYNALAYRYQRDQIGLAMEDWGISLPVCFQMVAIDDPNVDIKIKFFSNGKYYK